MDWKFQSSTLEDFDGDAILLKEFPDPNPLLENSDIDEELEVHLLDGGVPPIPPTFSDDSDTLTASNDTGGQDTLSYRIVMILGPCAFSPGAQAPACGIPVLFQFLILLCHFNVLNLYIHPLQNKAVVMRSSWRAWGIVSHAVHL